MCKQTPESEEMDTLNLHVWMAHNAYFFLEEGGLPPGILIPERKCKVCSFVLSLRGKVYLFTKPAAIGKLPLCAFLIIIQLYGCFREHKTANAKQGLLGTVLLENNTSKSL